MRIGMKRRVLRVALVTVAVPVAAWALEQAARRASARDKTSPTSRRLRQGADFVQRFGRGPLAARLAGDRSRRPPTGTGSHSEPTSMAASYLLLKNSGPK